MAQQTAKLKYLRMAPRKVRAVADIIRGMSVNEAEAQLIFQRRRASQALLKLLRSAVSNAKNNKLNPEKMIIGKIAVDQGPMLKRMMLRARGGSSGIQKKSSHITLILEEVENIKEKRFNILVPKKAKIPKDETKRKKKKDEPKDEGEKAKPEAKPGVLQKVFRRKSMSGGK